MKRVKIARMCLRWFKSLDSSVRNDKSCWAVRKLLSMMITNHWLIRILLSAIKWNERNHQMITKINFQILSNAFQHTHKFNWQKICWHFYNFFLLDFFCVCLNWRHWHHLYLECCWNRRLIVLRLNYFIKVFSKHFFLV